MVLMKEEVKCLYNISPAMELDEKTFAKMVFNFGHHMPYPTALWTKGTKGNEGYFLFYAFQRFNNEDKIIYDVDQIFFIKGEYKKYLTIDSNYTTELFSEDSKLNNKQHITFVKIEPDILKKDDMLSKILDEIESE